MEREGKFDKLKLKEFKADEKVKDAKMRMQLICDNEIIYLWYNCINECI